MNTSMILTKPLFSSLSSIAFLLLVAVPGFASTPDDMTPAEETVCDELHEATPGLFGLCVAYCEAQDCDFEDAISGQCSAPNPTLLDIYERKRKPEDPPMPCLVSEARDECPCFMAEELPELELTTCNEIDFGIRYHTVLTTAINDSGVLVEVTWEGTGRCMYRDDSDPNLPIVSDAETDETQTAACQAIVDDYILAADLFCAYRD